MIFRGSTPCSRLVLLLLLALSSGHGGAATSLRADSALFGDSQASEEALLGILYDFKQTQDLQPTDINGANYFGLLDTFMASGWDEHVFGPYYRTTDAVYATQIMIPVITANAAPEAFGVEHLIRPSLWAVHYKAQVLPPHPGRFRFAGYADDFLALAINGETILISGRMRPGSTPKTAWRDSGERGIPVANGQLFFSDWIELDGVTPVDFDLLIGERPGGAFAAVLKWQEEGRDYAHVRGRHGVLLPALQFVPAPIPDGLPHAEGFPLWKVVP